MEPLVVKKSARVHGKHAPDIQAEIEVEKTTDRLLRLQITRCRGACLKREDGGEKI